MKLDARITILGDKDGVEITIEDHDANVTICKVKLSPTEFVDAAMGRLSYIECVAEVNHPERIGTQHENRQHEFKLTNQDCSSRHCLESAYADALRTCPEGWQPDNYFGSRSLFVKDGERWARCTIRRWVPKGVESCERV